MFSGHKPFVVSLHTSLLLQLFRLVIGRLEGEMLPRSLLAYPAMGVNAFLAAN